MKKILFYLFILTLLLIVRFSSAQKVEVNQGQTIESTSEGYRVSITVTPKKATTLIVEQIKGKTDNTIVTPNATYEIIYSGEGYTLNDTTFTTVSDLRKHMKVIIRKDLNIK